MSHFNFLINIYVVEKTQYSYDSADFIVELHFLKSAYKLCADCKPQDDVSVSYLQSRCITTILSTTISKEM